jgi:hypothetical protein
MRNVSDEQLEVCRRLGINPCPSPEDSKVGVASNIRTGLQPINGLRHPPEGDTTGWYLWAGEVLRTDADFFQPLHVKHLAEWNPAVLPYLALPPGWRFLLAPDYVDVWHDPALLEDRPGDAGDEL